VGLLEEKNFGMVPLCRKFEVRSWVLRSPQDFWEPFKCSSQSEEAEVVC
jgi:hypothetical protein